MKKLVCATEVKAAAEKGQKLFCVDCNTIITPSAKDLAKQLGVEFTLDSAGLTSSSGLTGLTGLTGSTGSKGSNGSSGSSLAGNQTCNDSGLQKEDTSETVIDRDMIYQVVKAVLTNSLLAGVRPSPETPFRAEGDPQSGLKIVRGRTVKLETFDTGNPKANVAYREVISKEDSQMSAGFLTIEKSSFEWELGYQEIDIVLEGSLSMTINGETYHAHQGDVLYVPKGSKVTWSSADYVKLFYVTYPANWAEQ